MNSCDLASRNRIMFMKNKYLIAFSAPILEKRSGSSRQCARLAASSASECQRDRVSRTPFVFPTASIDKGFESKDNHKAKLLFAITSRKGLTRHARI